LSLTYSCQTDRSSRADNLGGWGTADDSSAPGGGEGETVRPLYNLHSWLAGTVFV
jgi:hypothetical protein